MTKKLKKNSTKSFPLFRLIPNLVTLISLCIGLSAIRYSISGDFVKATSFVLLAGFLDGIDGRIARFLNSVSDFGAQLDSLADFVNFGVTPGFVIYMWVNSFADIRGLDWALVLFFSVCSAIRLARFNVDLTKEVKNPTLEKYFFKGIPAPCGAAMSMLPMVLYYEFGNGFYSNPYTIITYVAVLAILMASTVPTISIKKIPVRNEHAAITLIVLALIIIGLAIQPWFTLAIIGTIYGLSIPVTILVFIKIELSSKQAPTNLNN